MLIIDEGRPKHQGTKKRRKPYDLEGIQWTRSLGVVGDMFGDRIARPY